MKAFLTRTAVLLAVSAALAGCERIASDGAPGRSGSGRRNRARSPRESLVLLARTLRAGDTDAYLADLDPRIDRKAAVMDFELQRELQRLVDAMADAYGPQEADRVKWLLPGHPTVYSERDAEAAEIHVRQQIPYADIRLPDGREIGLVGEDGFWPVPWNVLRSVPLDVRESGPEELKRFRRERQYLSSAVALAREKIGREGYRPDRIARELLVRLDEFRRGAYAENPPAMATTTAPS